MMRFITIGSLVFCLTLITLTGCQESESEIVQRARLIGNENLKLKKQLQEKDHQIEQLKKDVQAAEADALKAQEDAGNATMKLGQGMWIFTPKLNQIIKLPASMMAQSWMGSDFSYDDLAKTDKIIHEYTHTLIDTQQENKHTVYTIESIPKTGAPVVWSKERLRIRDDFVLLEETFFDQDLQPAKRMQTLKIGPMGGRDYPVVMRMTTLDKPDHWTEINTRHAMFDLALPSYLFTLSNLRNPRPWSAQ